MQPLAIHRYGPDDAPVLLLLHGLTEAGTAWPDLVDRWGGSWGIVAPDLRGHGRSPRFTEDQLASAIDVMLADVVSLLDEQPEPVVLIGHSLGGLLALRAALARPDRVRALVLEDPARPRRGSTPDPELVAGTEAFLDVMAADAAAETTWMMRETSWSEAEIRAWAECKPLVDRDYIHRGLQLGDTRWEAAFEELAVPTLLVVPPNAEMAPRGVRNPLVHVVVIPESGHCVRRDQPDRFFAAVEHFLADLPA